MKPAIIVIAFNRPLSLARVLSSLTKAKYRDLDIPLCICIDYHESAQNREVFEIAQNFNWAYGEKCIIHQEKNLGLKEHVLKCGDLTELYGSIIMLEDDITVSPNFYTYTIDALKYYEDQTDIAGISLYNHRLNFNNLLKFEPLSDNSDVYFLKVASSWGQSWNKKQWNSFRNWLLENPSINQESTMPAYVKRWPSSSWLKHFIEYLEATNSYFVFPRISLSTNWSDAGSNNAQSSTFFQVPMEFDKSEYKFIPCESSLAKYDSHFEIIPESLKKLCPNLKGYDFVVDLYGLKEKYNQPYVISSNKCKSSLKSYDLKLRPLELNIINEQPGKTFHLGRSENFSIKSGLSHNLDNKAVYNYFFGALSFKIKLKHIKKLILVKLGRI